VVSTSKSTRLRLEDKDLCIVASVKTMLHQLARSAKLTPAESLLCSEAAQILSRFPLSTRHAASAYVDIRTEEGTQPVQNWAIYVTESSLEVFYNDGTNEITGNPTFTLSVTVEMREEVGESSAWLSTVSSVVIPALESGVASLQCRVDTDPRA